MHGRKTYGKSSTCKTEKEMDHIKLDLREVGCKDMSWMELPEDRVQWRALELAILNL
jgi:hypothetical protein